MLSASIGRRCRCSGGQPRSVRSTFGISTKHCGRGGRHLSLLRIHVFGKILLNISDRFSQ